MLGGPSNSSTTDSGTKGPISTQRKTTGFKEIQKKRVTLAGSSEELGREDHDLVDGSAKDEPKRKEGAVNLGAARRVFFWSEAPWCCCCLGRARLKEPPE